MATSDCVGCGGGCGTRSGIGIPTGLPGEPSNDSILSAVPANGGGVQLRWSPPLLNPSSVAYTRIWRSTTNQFANAVEVQSVSATAWLDADAGYTVQPYWYWIGHVSIYGTALAPIGPQGATPTSRADSVLQEMLGKIGSLQLQGSLWNQINRINEIEGEVQQIQADINADVASLAAQYAAVNTELVAINAEINQEVAGLRGEADAAKAQLLGQIQGNGSAITNLQNLTATQAQTITGLATRLGSAESAIVTVNTTTANQASQITSLTSTVNANNTAINSRLDNSYYTKTQADSAIAASSSALTTSFDNKLAGYTNTAGLTQNYYTKSATDSAISAATLNLVSSTGLNTALAAYTTTASLTQNYYTKTQADSAISTATTGLVSATALTSTLGSYATTANLSTNYFTKTETNSAISSATQNLVSTTSLNSTLGSYATTANLSNNYYTRTQTDSAISTATSTLVSNTTLTNTLGSYATNATLTNSYYTKTQTDSAISTATQNFVSTATLNNYTTTASLQATYYTKASAASVEGQYSIKIDTNGRVAGFGLISTGSNTSTPTSAFVIRADKFAVVDPDSTANFLTNTPSPSAVPFAIIGGVTYIKTGAIQDGTVTNAKIGNFIQSNNFNGAVDSAGNITGNGTVGWAIGKAGKAVFNDVVVRGDITANSVTANSITSDSITNGGLGREHAYYDPNRVNVGTSGAGVWTNIADTGVTIAFGRTLHGTVSFAARQTDGRNGAEHRVRVLRQFSDGTGDYVCWGGVDGAPITTGYDGTTTSITFFDPYLVAGKFANYRVQMMTLFGDDRIAIVERSMFLRELSKSLQTDSIVARSTVLPPPPSGYDGGATYDPPPGTALP